MISGTRALLLLIVDLFQTNNSVNEIDRFQQMLLVTFSDVAIIFLSRPKEHVVRTSLAGSFNFLCEKFVVDPGKRCAIVLNQLHRRIVFGKSDWPELG